jgi:hypothetical protein
MALFVAGLLTGVIGGLFGVGGGEIFIPLLVSVFGFSRHQAQGNSPAVPLPLLPSHRAGYVDFPTAGLLALGLFPGASVGAVVTTRMHGDLLRRVVGALLLLAPLHMIFGRHGSR